MKTIYGVKATMTQAWDVAGKRLPVTIVKTSPLVVTAIKTLAKDGYNAIQVGLGSQKASRVNKPLKNQLKPAIQGDVYPRHLKEIRLDTVPEKFSLGQAISVDAVINVGDKVDVTGISRGHGFEGVMKRWGFHGGPKTHGQSDRARAPGSIGQGTSPGRVHKGKKMAGHYGSTNHVVKNIVVVKVDMQNQEVWLSGPIPGSTGTVVEINISGKTTFPGLREAVQANQVTEAGI
jgi:large subunit ribosomal protein L3